MDRQIVIAKVSKMMYKLMFRTNMYKSTRTKKNPKLAHKMAEKFMTDDDSIVIPKNKTIQIGKKISKKDFMLPTKIVEYFIEKSCHRVVMNFCICRDSNHCKDYPIELGCMFMGEAAKGIHPDLGRSVSKEEAREHIRKCEEAGLVHVIGKAKLDTIWLDIHPGSKLFTVCNCCPCCCISKGVPYLGPELANKMSKLPGLKVTINKNCTACGKCLEECIYNGMKAEGDKMIITEDCRGCGRCASVCPNNAVEITLEDKTYVDSVIKRLSSKIDVA